jgi:2'-5' RNA ligase
MSLVRTFLAVNFPEEAVAQVARCAAGLAAPCQRVGLSVAWVPAQNLHLTLAFLGSVEEDMLREVSAALRQALRGAPAPRAGLMSLGAFPSPARPRVLYVGVDEEGGLIGLQGQIVAVLETLGFPREDRPFRPHLTIGRVRDPRGSRGAQRTPAEGVAGLLQPFAGRRFGVPAELREVVLYESRLGGGPPVYVPRDTLQLG